MKNLLIYTGANKKFGEEDSVLAKIQIDNSFDLGWKKEDIMLVTDFAFAYNGIQSMVIPDGMYYDFDKNANKIPVVVYLIKNNLISEKDLYWCHDFDVYENYFFDESELELKNFDLGLTHYTYKPEWQCGSFFFKTGAWDIFELVDRTTRAKPHSSRNNEKTLTKLINRNAIDSRRYKRMNVTYNITKRYIERIYPLADKPLKVLHFRPSDKDPLMSNTALEMFMYGKNRLKIPLMNERIIKIFNHHGIK